MASAGTLTDTRRSPLRRRFRRDLRGYDKSNLTQICDRCGKTHVGLAPDEVDWLLPVAGGKLSCDVRMFPVTLSFADPKPPKKRMNDAQTRVSRLERCRLAVHYHSGGRQLQ